MRVEDDVSRLEVPVDDLHRAEILQSHDYLCGHVLGQDVVEAALPPKKL